MAVVWSAICALAAVAAGAEQVPGADAPQMRTKVLPGHGYIRYEVAPGDDDSPPGELIVMHEERRTQQSADAEPVPEQPAQTPVRARIDRCAAPRAQLLVRIFQMQGMQVDPEFAVWLEKNLRIGTAEVPTLQLVSGDSLLLTALKADGITRGLAEDLARCERANAR
jgi:hypothetical protein